MHRNCGVLSAVLIALVASVSEAQTRAAVTAGVSQARKAPGVIAPKRNPARQDAAAANRPKFSLHAGIASGDNELDLGFALGGAATWDMADWPVDVRGDLYFARHGGDVGGVDLSLSLFGASGQVVYVFPTTNSAMSPYILGGLGLFYSSFDIDVDAFPGVEDSYGDSSTDLGLLIGGGLNFSQRLGAEIRFMSVDDFTTFPILLVIRF
jgi:hypothetical protein